MAKNPGARPRKSDFSSTGEDIKFAKNIQLTTINYALLLYFGIIIYFKISGEFPKDEIIIKLFIWLTRLLTAFSLFYQIHTALSLWQYRNRANINLKYQKVLWFVYLAFILAILIITHVITCRTIASQTNRFQYLLFRLF